MFLEVWKSSHAVVETMRAKAIGKIDVGSLMVGDSTPLGIFGSQNQQYNARYNQFRGWLYAAINAIALQAAAQPTYVGLLRGAATEDQRRVVSQQKSLSERKAAKRLELKAKALRHFAEKKMPTGIRTKAAAEEWEILQGHAFSAVLDNPNPSQTKWQFTYMFVANLVLTGYGYVVGGQTDNGFEMYAIPTSWITPIYKEGEGLVGYKVLNPAQSRKTQGSTLPVENVACAYLPNPSDPNSAISPTGTQSNAVQIDEHIQTSQLRFFQNGMFPSVIVTIGKDPHPDAPGGGIRPRLTGEQRRQVIGAIRKSMSSVENYGNPAIVDGMIEKIERLSATSNEMGWDKSEDKIRNRILSAFGVHPFILGEPLNVGGYAQATEIKQRFYERVNSYLEMLSLVATKFAVPFATRDRIFAWWENCDAVDPSIKYQNLREARKIGDISENEFRAELGFAPNEEAETDRSPLLDNPQTMSTYVQLASGVANRTLSYEGAAYTLAQFLQIEVEEAKAMLGPEPEEPELVPPQLQQAPPVAEDPEEDNMMEDSDMINSEDTNDEALSESIRSLGIAVRALVDVSAGRALANYDL